MRTRGVLVVSLYFVINVCSVSASNEIRLKSRRFTPDKGIGASTQARIELGPSRAHVLIQLESVPTIKEKEELEAKGIKLLSYIPDKAWFASIDSEKVREIAAFPDMRAISEIFPDDKISSIVRETGVGDYSINEDGTVNLTIEFFPDVSFDDAKKLISDYGGVVIGEAPITNVLEVTISSESIGRLANEDIVKWINEFPPPPLLYNNGLRGAIGVDAVQASPYNLTGTGVIVGQWDGGFIAPHGDLDGRVIQPNWDEDEVEPHSIHVAGTMLGNGTVNSTYRGVATNAILVVYKCWDTISELYSDHDGAIKAYGIDISQNSWGWDVYGVYNERCEAVDGIVRGALGRPITMVWAAGNKGHLGWNKIGNPCGAKNVITVGATKSDTNTIALYTEGDFPWGSSLGPMDDGRIKPDVMAPGCEGTYDTGDPDESIWSTADTSSYSGMCGTSSAAPAVSGTVALMIEDWRDNHSGQPDPLPSTVKAILMHTATDLGNTGPDYSYGYGLIDAKDAIDLIRQDSTDNVILEGSIGDQGDTDSFTVEVPINQSELKITLVWDDYPGDPSAEEALVNDLDLIVKDPSETRCYPWTLDPLNPANPAEGGTDGDEDHINNIEQVVVDNPTSGTWTIEISGTTVPKPPQVYSLVSNIEFDPAPPCAYDGSFRMKVDSPVRITLIATDDGLPASPGILSYIITSLPSSGTLSDFGAGQISSVPYTLVSNGQKVTYTPSTGYVGSDSFKFKANDGGSSSGGGDSDEATISVDVFGLVHWWKLDETTGTTAEDSVGSDDGTVSGAQWITAGQINGALQFDGQDYVILGALDVLKGGAASISAWIKVNDTTFAWSPIVTQRAYSEGKLGYYLCLNYSAATFFLDETCVQSPSTDPVSVGEWHHIAGTYDGHELMVYVDGLFKGSTICYEREGQDTGAYIGGDVPMNYYFYGTIDDVRVYHSADVDTMFYGTSKFSILNASGVRMAWFDDLGNLFLRGRLTRREGAARPSATADGEFIIQDSTGNLAVINGTTGDMEIWGFLRLDSASQWEDPDGTEAEFIIHNDQGNPVAYIDELGNVYLKGRLFEQ